MAHKTAWTPSPTAPTWCRSTQRSRARSRNKSGSKWISWLQFSRLHSGIWPHLHGTLQEPVPLTHGLSHEHPVWNERVWGRRTLPSRDSELEVFLHSFCHDMHVRAGNILSVVLRWRSKLGRCSYRLFANATDDGSHDACRKQNFQVSVFSFSFAM